MCVVWRSIVLKIAELEGKHSNNSTQLAYWPIFKIKASVKHTMYLNMYIIHIHKLLFAICYICFRQYAICAICYVSNSSYLFGTCLVSCLTVNAILIDGLGWPYGLTLIIANSKRTMNSQTQSSLNKIVLSRAILHIIIRFPVPLTGWWCSLPPVFPDVTTISET